MTPPPITDLPHQLQPRPAGAVTGRHDARNTSLDRAATPGYARWIEHTATAAGCSRPIRLTGHIHALDADTGETLRTRSTEMMPDRALYIPCGDRRAEVCPACAETYRADTYHMIKAGLTGGKDVPDSVASHPAVFTTVTAPSFGPVHTHTTTADGTTKPCRPRRQRTHCPHGRPEWCTQRHPEGSRHIGTPLCPDCYDYQAHAMFNAYASELWRRTKIRLDRLATQLAASHSTRLTVSYAKVAEYQHRGVVHFHAIFRLDTPDEHDPSLVHPPPAGITSAHLDALITHAAAGATYTTPPHPGNTTAGIAPRPKGWTLTWGEQLRNRPLTRCDSDTDITEAMVAGYVAKYATKSTEATGITARRITADTIGAYTDDTHTGRLIATCWDLGANPHNPGQPAEPHHRGTLTRANPGSHDTAALRTAHERYYPPEHAHQADQRDAWKHTHGRLRRWTHMLGFGGHFTTRTHRYGPTRKHLKAIRRAWHHQHNPQHDDTTLIVNQLTYAGTGWLTTGDQALALTAAAKAREQRHQRTTEQQAA